MAYRSLETGQWIGEPCDEFVPDAKQEAAHRNYFEARLQLAALKQEFNEISADIVYECEKFAADIARVNSKGVQ